jgi:long-subunit acyl-CoA synthetase (AMP-forming)
MRGYYNNQQATDEAITRDGWFKSGDLASIDEEGFVYIKDRGNFSD